MIKKILLFGFLYPALFLAAQDYYISFGVSGSTDLPVSVKATNLDQNVTFNLAGDYTLHLVEEVVGAEVLFALEKDIKVYPNPFKNYTMVEFYSPNSGFIQVAVSDISGRIVEKQEVQILQGINTIGVSSLSVGTYIIMIHGQDINYSALLLSQHHSNDQTDRHLTIHHGLNSHRSYQPELTGTNPTSFKSTTGATIEMQYNDGEEMLFEGFSEPYSSRVTLIPNSNQTIEFEFWPVTDFYADPLNDTLGKIIQFTDQSSNSPGSWLWDFGDGGTSIEKHPEYAYPAAGVFAVSLTATNVYGSSTESKVDYITVTEVIHIPVAEFSASATVITEGDQVEFTDLSDNSPTSWSWDFGDGGTSTLQNPSYIYASAGTYTVSLTVSNSAGSDNETKTYYITVGSPPVADFVGSPTTIGVGESVQFTDQSTNSPTNWSWDFGDGQTSAERNPSHIYSSVGTYTVSLTVMNSFGQDTETKTDYITGGSPPDADFVGSPTTIGVGESVQFTDLSTNYPTSWSWDFGDGQTSTLRNPSRVYASAGTYTVSLTVSNSFGQDTETKTDYIIVGGPPDADFVGSPTTIGEGESVQFTDQSTNNPTSGTWNFGDGQTVPKDIHHIYMPQREHTLFL